MTPADKAALRKALRPVLTARAVERVMDVCESVTETPTPDSSQPEAQAYHLGQIEVATRVLNALNPSSDLRRLVARVRAMVREAAKEQRQ